MTHEIIARRLKNQRLTATTFRTPADVVSWHGAVQAQEYAVAKWGVALRAKDLDDAVVEQAFADGRILRTHVMRPTWHFVAPADIRWMLDLTAPRLRTLMASYDRRLELDARLYARSNDAIARALEGGRHLTRAELGDALERVRIHARGQRLGHVMMRAELDQVVCSGPRRGKQFTYALLEERVPASAPRTREDALAELARRYFSSHGPATVKDYSWWSGLTMPDARMALDLLKPAVVREVVDGLTYWSLPSRGAVPPASPTEHLLPIYDEYLIAYKDRELVVSEIRSQGFPPIVQDPFAYHLVVDGLLAGHWRRTVERTGSTVSITPYRSLGRAGEARVRRAAERFATFLGHPVAVSVQPAA